MIRLLAFDLDGTVLTKNKGVSPRNKEALLAAGEKGVILVPASGRMKTFLPKEIVELPGVEWAITANGAGVYHLPTGKAVWQSLMSNEKAKAIQKVLDQYDIYIEYYSQGAPITRADFPKKAAEHFGFPKEKMLFVKDNYTLVDDFGKMLEETKLCPEKINIPYLPSQELQQELREKLSAIPGLRITSSVADNLEINDEMGNKGAGLAALCEMLHIPAKEVMSAGDNGNDITMLQFAGVSVCMGDGSEEAKAAAKFVGEPHDQDGFGKAVERFVLGVSDE